MGSSESIPDSNRRTQQDGQDAPIGVAPRRNLARAIFRQAEGVHWDLAAPGQPLNRAQRRNHRHWQHRREEDV